MEKVHIYIATLLPAEGDTGVQTHFQNFYRFAKLNGVERIYILSPYDLHKIFRGPVRRFSKLVSLYSRELGILLERRFLSLLLYWRLWYFLKIHNCYKCIIYSQDPLTAKVALQLKRKGYPIDVALAIHFNISQAFEVVERGISRPNSALYRHFIRLEEAVIASVDRLIFVSQFMEKIVLKRIPLAANVPRSVTPCTIIDEAKSSDTEKKADIITIGTIEPRKNQQFLIRVLAEATRLGYNYQLTIVGNGEYRDQLKSLVRELNMTNHVTFAGYVPNAKQLIWHHRAYVHASKMESLGIALIEALSCGKPIFAAPVGGIPEIFEDGSEGVYWSLDDPIDAARKLIMILEDQELYGSMAKAARKRYETNFQPNIVFPKLLKSVLGN